MEEGFGKNREKLEHLLKANANNENKKVNIKALTHVRRDEVISDGALNNQINNIMKIFTSKKIFNFIGIPKIYNEMSYYTKWWKFYDNMITICNVFILLISFYDYEINYTYPRKRVAEYTHIRLLLIAITLFSIFCVLKRHYMKLKWKLLKDLNKVEGYDQKIEEINDHLEFDNILYKEEKNTFFSQSLIIDLLINLILPYPLLDFEIYVTELDRDENKYIQITYLFSDFIYMLNLLRLIYIVRSFINFSIFSDNFAVSISKSYNVTNNIRFSLKCLLKTDHIKIVMWFFVFSVAVFGFILRLVERPIWSYNHRIEFEPLLTSMWLIFCTMLTIGFGDYAPLTTLGKLICFFAGLWGVFISSLIVVCLNGLLDLSNDQFMVYLKITRSRSAARFIENAFILYKSRRFINKNKIQITKNKTCLKESFIEFKNMRNESKSIYRSNGLLYYNMKLFKQMRRLNQKFSNLEHSIESNSK